MKPKLETSRLDCKMIEPLQRNARISNSDIGKIVNMLQQAMATGEGDFVAKASYAHMIKVEASVDALVILGLTTTLRVPASYPPKLLPARQEAMQP